MFEKVTRMLKWSEEYLTKYRNKLSERTVILKKNKTSEYYINKVTIKSTLLFKVSDGKQEFFHMIEGIIFLYFCILLLNSVKGLHSH